MSDSVRPHRRQPTRLLCPWDSPGKNTGVGCHFLFQCMKVKSESEVTQSCPTLSDPMDCSLPGSSVHGIFQARVLESGIMPSPNSTLGSFKGKVDQTSCAVILEEVSLAATCLAIDAKRQLWSVSSLLQCASILPECVCVCVCVCMEGDLRTVMPDSMFPWYLYCSCGHKTITLKSIILTVTPLTSGELCLNEKG